MSELFAQRSGSAFLWSPLTSKDIKCNMHANGRCSFFLSVSHTREILCMLLGGFICGLRILMFLFHNRIVLVRISTDLGALLQSFLMCPYF